jgi:protein-S-isoprenylcysteine O-methyltransferase Ste14
MFVRYSSYVLLFNFIYHYYDFFLWYLGDQPIQIEYAYYKGIYAFTSALIFIIYIHILFFPKNKLDTPRIPSFPPLIMLFSLNFGLFIGIYNLYIIKLYKLPEFLNYLRSIEIGLIFILLSFILIYLSIQSFKNHREDPNPTTKSNILITSGIFKYIRNPMYLALTLFQFGIGASLSFIHICLMSFVTIVLLHYFVVKKEEEYLTDRFGNSYITYLNSTRRWL